MTLHIKCHYCIKRVELYCRIIINVIFGVIHFQCIRGDILLKKRIIICISVLSLVIVLLVINNILNFNPYKDGIGQVVEKIEICTPQKVITINDNYGINSIIDIVENYEMHFDIIPANRSGGLTVDIYSNDAVISIVLLDGNCIIDGIKYYGDDYATDMWNLLDQIES